MIFKLGKLPPSKRDCVRFGDFLTSFPTHPLVDFAPNYNYPMDLNDQYGDCVVAGFDHFRQVVTGLLTGTQLNFTEDEIIAFYKTQNPGFPDEDNGMDIQTFLEYLVANKYILGFASVDWTNQQELQSAVYLGLGLMAGVQLQSAQEGQFQQGASNPIWDYVQGSPVIGGHCVPPVGYNNANSIIVSWAKLVTCTPRFIQNCMDECWFVLTQSHVDHPNFRDNFDLQGFSDAVREITGGKIVIPVPSPISKPTATITRKPSDRKETLGTLVAKNGRATFNCDTLELLWLENQINISCIPVGTYQVAYTFSPRLLKYTYEIQNVPNRSGIRIHVGNFYTDLLGCICLGNSVGDINSDGELDVLNSTITINSFEGFMQKQPFTLTIQ